MAQPNFPALAQNIRNIANEIALLPNALASNQALLQQIQGAQQQIIQRLDQLEALLPIRLLNASASMDAPLVYPPGVDLPVGVPSKKQDLLFMSEVKCQAMAAALNLPALPPTPSVTAQRQQIIDHLGAAMMAFA